MQSYRMPLDQARKLTMPQILMLNHGAAVNKARLDRKLKNETGGKSKPGSPRNNGRQAPATDWPVYEGKPVNELDSKSYMRYLASVMSGMA